MTTPTVVLNGVGPSIKVRLGNDNPKMLVIKNNKITKVSKSADIKFAS